MNLKIGSKIIGDDSNIFIIAELSANHNQNYDIAVKSIKAIKECGADAIKLQTYTPDILTLNNDSEIFKIKGTIWDGEKLYDLYNKAYTPWEWQPKLIKIAEEAGLICFSSPFDRTAVDFLEKINVPAYKIASFEITDIPLIEYAASKGKPVIISTGIAEEAEIIEAVEACRRSGNDKIILLKCTSAYPASFEDMNLRTIPELGKKFNVIPGLSDHTLGITVPIASVSLGVKVIEKHFILDRNLGGPDASFSLNPVEFKLMVDSVRDAEKALGKATFELSEKDKKNRVFARSLFIVKDVKANEEITEENVRSIRPSNGLPPKYLSQIIGKKFRKEFKSGTPLIWEMIE